MICIWLRPWLTNTGKNIIIALHLALVDANGVFDESDDIKLLCGGQIDNQVTDAFIFVTTDELLADPQDLAPIVNVEPFSRLLHDKHLLSVVISAPSVFQRICQCFPSSRSSIRLFSIDDKFGREYLSVAGSYDRTNQTSASAS